MESTSFLQSDEWANFLTAYGLPVRRVAGLTYSRRNIPFGNYWLCSRVQLDKTNLGSAWSELRQSTFLRYEPLDTVSQEQLQYFARAHRLRLNAVPAIQPRQTLILDLNQSDEAILASMKPKHRYNLRLAQKHTLSVEAYTGKAAIAQADRFLTLIQETARRQSFRLHPTAYYRTLLEVLAPREAAHLLFVRQPERTRDDLATLLLLTHNQTATYLHGGSREQYKSLMAPYLLHWEAFQYARRRGCDRYDFWGTDARQEPESRQWLPRDDRPSYGTTRFKLGFGGHIIQYPGTFDLILNPFCYTVYTVGRKLRRSQRAFS
jgi:lipid II:glycine glycyltransferase (peptidoglycan interpeptide bridge formation enzyme)